MLRLLALDPRRHSWRAGPCQHPEHECVAAERLHAVPSMLSAHAPVARRRVSCVAWISGEECTAPAPQVAQPPLTSRAAAPPTLAGLPRRRWGVTSEPPRPPSPRKPLPVLVVQPDGSDLEVGVMDSPSAESVPSMPPTPTASTDRPCLGSFSQSGQGPTAAAGWWSTAAATSFAVVSGGSSM